jgi:hypothetical protein
MDFYTIFLSRYEILKRQNKMAYNFNCSHLSDHQKMISGEKVTAVSKVAKKLAHPVLKFNFRYLPTGIGEAILNRVSRRETKEEEIQAH